MVSITIYRGTHQIGGGVTEIETDTNRIIIDFGSNLPDMKNKNSFSDDEIIEKVFGNDRKKCDAVLFSHYHNDHFGMYKKVPNDVKMFIGKTAKKISLILTERTDFVTEEKGYEKIKNMYTYIPREILEFGDIQVIPLVVDHSALDSYMFLINAQGKQILFSGDFRNHGIVSENNRFYKMINSYLDKNIDILITEGTMLSRKKEIENNDIVKSEQELQNRAKEIFKRNKYNFVLVSSTNIDSIMSFYNAIPNDKAFVCDEYQYLVINTAIKDKGKYYSKYRKRCINGNELPTYILGNMFDLGRADRCYPTDLEKLKEKGFVAFVRYTSEKFKDFINEFEKENSLIIYSLWKGYLSGANKKSELIDFIGDYKKINLHTSGHAYPETIKNFIEHIQPKVIIPMHTEMADEFYNFDEFKKFKDKINVLGDGEKYILN